MRTYDLNLHYFISDVEKHKEIKDKLISLIYDEEINSIYKKELITDYGVDNGKSFKEKRYAKLFLSSIESIITEMCVKFNCNTVAIDSMWFQVYGKGHYHKWHTHAYSNFTNVYYLHLPDNSLKTEFYDSVGKKHIDIDVKEGQIITMPAFVYHRSKDNNTNDKKIIISFNSNMMQLESLKSDSQNYQHIVKT